MKSNKRLRRRGGFSLLEALMAVIILGIVAAVVLPRILISREEARESACFQHKRVINFAVEQYFQDTGSLPSSISDLNTNDYFPGGIPSCPISGASAYTLDSSTKRVDGHTTGSH